MKDEAKKQLQRILDAYDARLAEAERLEAAARAAKAAFPERFSSLMKETILPTLRELAEVLNGRGHDATVREQEESSTSGGGVMSAAAGLRIIPKAFAHKPTDAKKSFVEVTFSANRSEQKVAVSTTTTIMKSGGGVGKRGEYAVDNLTTDVVVDQVLRTLEQAFVEA